MLFSSKLGIISNVTIQFIGIGSLLILATSFVKLSSGTLIVKVSNITKIQGQVYVAVFDQSKGFPDDTSQMFHKAFYDVKTKTLTCRVKNVPFGKVALSIFHDVNGNGNLDKGWFGIPQEPFGFSTNYTPIVSAPGFDDCYINFSKNEQIESIRLIE